MLADATNFAEAQFVFRDVGDEAGLFPAVSKIAGHSAAWGDIDGDGWPDLYVSTFGGHPYDSKPNQLFRNVRGKFTLDEQPVLRVLGRASGSVFADLDNDGDLDLYLSNHAIDAAAYKQPHYGAPNFLFRNDGWPDISTPIVKFASGKTYPVIFQSLGVDAATGLPRFREDALVVNDFPTPDDVKLAGTGGFFDKLEREKKIVYTAPGPSGDFDRDGRLDFFLANWWVTARSMLLKNETPGGHWLDVAVDGTAKPGALGVNRAGIGAVVRVYPAGQLGQPKELLGTREISSSQGYTSGQEPLVHFGLGVVERVDVEVVLPHGRGRWERRNVAADQRIVVSEMKKQPFD